MPFPASLSVVTYTYNDHPLAADLLASIRSWSVRPREVLVVDDGSDTPFRLPDNEPNVRLLRLEHNLGATRAKEAGISAALCKFILSIDCDVRLDRPWLEVTLPIAAKPDTGIVSTPLLHHSGEDIVSRYMGLVYSFDAPVGLTDFVPGGVWLLRRDVWDRLGGLADYQDRIGEDSHFCDKLAKWKLKMVLAPRVKAWEVRRLTRVNMVKRGFAWQGSHMFTALNQGVFLGDVLGALLFSVSKRLPTTTAREPAFAYFDLLYLAHGLLTLAGTKDPALAADLKARLAAFPENHPNIRSILAHDLAKLGHAQPAPNIPQTGDAGRIMDTLKSMFDPAALDALETRGLAEILRADAAPKDFSFYSAM